MTETCKTCRTCKHATPIEAEAYQVGGRGTTLVQRLRCDFPDNEPERFVNAPLWLLRMVTGGILVSDEWAETCPAYTPTPKETT